MAIRVLLVGRHEALLEGLRAQLACETDLSVHVHTAGLEQAPACLRASEIDVVVMDGDCAMDAALGLARQAHTLRPDCGVLLIESTQIAPWREAECGDLLRGLIGRQDLPQCLPEAVRTVGEKGVYLSPEVRSRAIRTGCGLRYMTSPSSERSSTPPPPPGGLGGRAVNRIAENAKPSREGDDARRSPGNDGPGAIGGFRERAARRVTGRLRGGSLPTARPRRF